MWRNFWYNFHDQAWRFTRTYKRIIPDNTIAVGTRITACAAVISTAIAARMVYKIVDNQNSYTEALRIDNDYWQKYYEASTAAADMQRAFFQCDAIMQKYTEVHKVHLTRSSSEDAQSIDKAYNTLKSRVIYGIP
jgi:hypothetical protein